MSHNAPKTLGKLLTLAKYVDKNMYYNAITRCSNTGVVHSINQACIS